MEDEEIEYILLQYIDPNKADLADLDRARVDSLWGQLFANGCLQEAVSVAYTDDQDLVTTRRSIRTSAGATRLSQLKARLGKKGWG